MALAIHINDLDLTVLIQDTEAGPQKHIAEALLFSSGKDIEYVGNLPDFFGGDTEIVCRRWHTKIHKKCCQYQAG